MTTILTFLGNLRLSITQVAIGLVAVVVAVLAIALEITLGKLHSSNIKLLEATYGNDVSEQDRKTGTDREAFLKALKAYRGSK